MSAGHGLQLFWQQLEGASRLFPVLLVHRNIAGRRQLIHKQKSGQRGLTWGKMLQQKHIRWTLLQVTEPGHASNVGHHWTGPTVN